METPITTAATLNYNGYTAVLLRYPDGQVALWVEDEHLSGRSDTPGTYSLNDINTGVPLGADEDIDALIAEWKRNVEWDADADGDGSGLAE